MATALPANGTDAENVGELPKLGAITDTATWPLPNGDTARLPKAAGTCVEFGISKLCNTTTSTFLLAEKVSTPV